MRWSMMGRVPWTTKVLLLCPTYRKRPSHAYFHNCCVRAVHLPPPAGLGTLPAPVARAILEMLQPSRSRGCNRHFFPGNFSVCYSQVIYAVPGLLIRIKSIKTKLSVRFRPEWYHVLASMYTRYCVYIGCYQAGICV